MADPDDTSAAAESLVQEVAGEMGAQVVGLTALIHDRLTEEIADLRGDPLLLDLLSASIQSNLEAMVRIIRHGLPLAEATSPPAAAEYARRLAQRGTAPTALLRAYRLGQECALLWATDRIAALGSDREVALLASRRYVELAFKYVDALSAQVVAEYESERVRWLANSNSVRSATLSELLAGTAPDVTAAEASLGYRLRQHHVGVVLWLDHEGSPDDLRALEVLLVRLGKEIGLSGLCLFVPQDRSTGWGWLPLGRQPHRPGPVNHELAGEFARIGARVAIGGAAAGVEGFRSTHLEARSAQELAMVARRSDDRITSWSEPDVRAATLLMRDLEATRRLVAVSLGGLAADDDAHAGLRQTVRTFLAEKGSYTTAAAILNVHKNTVRYRLEKAVEARGRSLDEDRLDLELALIACDWLGTSVLQH